MATIFTGMMLMAILSIILPQQGEMREKTEKVKDPNRWEHMLFPKRLTAGLLLDCMIQREKIWLIPRMHMIQLMRQRRLLLLVAKTEK
jgi:hypothetical protein